MSEETTIRLDRMRYTKNTFSSGFALLAILFDVLFFISIYESDVGTYYYNILIGASILYNLVFMLAAFLSSEGVKNYNIRYAWLMVLLGIGQIVRVFIYPMRAHAAVVTVQEQSVAVMGDGQFFRVVLSRSSGSNAPAAWRRIRSSWILIKMSTPEDKRPPPHILRCLLL